MLPPSATIPIWASAIISPVKDKAAPLEYIYIPSVPTDIFPAFETTTVVPAPSAYTPIPPVPAVIDAVPVNTALEPPFTTTPIALLSELEAPTLIVPSIAEVVPDTAITPTLSSPKVTVPAFIFEVTPSRTTPVFLELVEIILFEVSPVVASLRYTPIPPVPVIIIVSFCTDFPLLAL